MEKKKMGFAAGCKEFIRKRIVSLKHKPQTIPMIMLVVTYLYYSLHLTHISDTTAAINITPMGLCGFVSMLFPLLSLVCFMNAFPSRKPANKPMVILLFVMMVAVLAADVVYMMTIVQAVSGPTKTLTLYIGDHSKLDPMNQALKTLWVHGILVVISLALVALLPLYSKLIRKIKTSIDVEAGEEMAAISVSDD